MVNLTIFTTSFWVDFLLRYIEFFNDIPTFRKYKMFFITYNINSYPRVQFAMQVMISNVFTGVLKHFFSDHSKSVMQTAF